MSPVLLWLWIEVAASVVAGAAAAAASGSPHACRWNPAGPLFPELEPSASICPPIVDWATAARTGRWDPWTKHPHCASRSPLQVGQPRYCVYTHSSFRGEAGLSLLTTPEVAAATAPLVDGVDPTWGRRPPSRSSAGLAGPRPLPPFEVRTIPGKGKGVVANASIPRGEVLIREQPVLVGTFSLPPHVEPREHRRLLQRAVAQLPQRDQKRVLELAHHAKSAGDVLQSILNSNTFSITLNNVEHSGLYPRISRINHACKPNAYVRYTRKTLEMEVVAYKDIEPGTELSISYTPLNVQSADRREMLKGWGFECSCSLCSSPSALAESDANRRKVQDLLDDMDDAETRAAGSGEVVRLAEEVLQVMEREGIMAQAGDVHAIVAQLLLEMGDITGARRFGESAVELLAEFAGPDSERSEQAVRFLEILEGSKKKRTCA